MLVVDGDGVVRDVGAGVVLRHGVRERGARRHSRHASHASHRGHRAHCAHSRRAYLLQHTHNTGYHLLSALYY